MILISQYIKNHPNPKRIYNANLNLDKRIDIKNLLNNEIYIPYYANVLHFFDKNVNIRKDICIRTITTYPQTHWYIFSSALRFTSTSWNSSHSVLSCSSKSIFKGKWYLFKKECLIVNYLKMRRIKIMLAINIKNQIGMYIPKCNQMLDFILLLFQN